LTRQIRVHVVEVRKEFMGLKYEYVSTENSMIQQKWCMQKKSKKVGLAHSLKNYLGNRLLHESETQQQCLPISTLIYHLG